MDLPSTGTILLEDYLYKWKYKEQDTKLWVYFFFQNNNVGNYEIWELLQRTLRSVIVLFLIA